MLNQTTNPTTGGTTPESNYSKLLELEKVPELQQCMADLLRAHDSIQAARVSFTCGLNSFAPVLGRSLSGHGIDPEIAKEAAQTFPAEVYFLYEAFQGLAGMLKNKNRQIEFSVNHPE